MSRIFLDTWLISKSCAKLVLFVLACAAAGLVHSVSAGRAHARTVLLPGCWQEGWPVSGHRGGEGMARVAMASWLRLPVPPCAGLWGLRGVPGKCGAQLVERAGSKLCAGDTSDRELWVVCS